MIKFQRVVPNVGGNTSIFFKKYLKAKHLIQADVGFNLKQPSVVVRYEVKQGSQQHPHGSPKDKGVAPSFGKQESHPGYFF